MLLQKKANFVSFLMWLMPVSFFAFQFILRTMPGIMMNDIIDQFGITALAFGALSACYYAGYSFMQIPVGILLDKFNSKYILSFCILSCVCGNLTFLYSDSWSLAVIGRFFVGVGSAVGFLGTAKTIRLWFPKEDYSKMVGFTFSLGLVGAVYGGKPVSLLLEQYGFVKVLEISSLIGALIALFIFILYKEPKDIIKIHHNSSVWQDVKSLFKNPKIVLIGIFGGMMVGPLEGFADIWGVNYFAQNYNLPRSEAALLTSFIFVGMCFGGPILAYFSKIIKSEIKMANFAGLMMAIIFIILFLGKNYDIEVIYILMFILGILCCYQVLIFSIINNIVDEKLSSLATALTNSLNMSFGFLFHLFIGYMMDKNWNGDMVNGIKFYSSNTYVISLAIIPVCLLIGSISLTFVNRK